MPEPATTTRALFERMLHLVHRRQQERYADLFADDATFELPFAPPGMPRRFEGKDAIRALLTAPRPRLRDMEWEFKDVVVHQTTDPDVIVTEFLVHVAGTESHPPYQFANLQVLTAREGRIASLRDYWSPLDRQRELASITDALRA
jgi:uncharacterized protein